jgi:hypothetical protein
MNSRRYPRTLAEAFGPYTSNVIETERHKSRLGTFLYGVLLFAALAGIGVLLAVRG